MSEHRASQPQVQVSAQANAAFSVDRADSPERGSALVFDRASFPSQPYRATQQALGQAHQALNASSQEFLHQFQLTFAQFEVLATLGESGLNAENAESPEDINMGTLAANLGVTKGTLTGLIDRLEAKQLVDRIVSTHDRRSCHIRLTPQGQTLFNQVFPAYLAHLKLQFAQFDRGELELLRVLLKKLQTCFTAS